MPRTADEQRRLIVDQFTRQAAPFVRMPAHSDEEAFRVVLAASGVRETDTVLDVACGPGLTACRFAEVARHVTGIDITPAMIEQARELQRSRGLDNLSWEVGDAPPLPFPDGSFSVAFSRYAFHHMLEPGAVLAEMARVCAPGGRVVVVDVYTVSPEQAGAYDRVERLRDPSHVRALGLDELLGMFRGVGLHDLATEFYGLEVGLEELLRASSPAPGAADEVRRIFADDLDRDRLGVGAHLKDGLIRFAFPIVVLVGRKPD
jgi:SAM-dependent methyltransferase